jgi:pterin-4a-carbinolamine dehydratase
LTRARRGLQRTYVTPHYETTRPDEVLSIDEARRLGWTEEPNALVRVLTYRDRPEAVRAAEELTDRVNDWGGRKPDMTIDGGRLEVRCANVNHAGVTLAELRLATKVSAALGELPPRLTQP